jgi:DNA-directed RNA polymerase I subunit RPA1
MNLHLVQNELARAEAMLISNADNQYVVPTDGSPLRGLIQDNVLTGVLLTKLDTFLSRGEYQQLLYSALQISPTLKLRTPVPTILKPATLWSGKQVLRGVLDLLTADRPPINLQSKSKVPASSWAQHSEEGVVIIRNNELLVGVLDKNQFGDAGYGLVHAVYELYGGETAGSLMSTLGRLFTLYLQSQGFTCGIDDMLLSPAAEVRRANLRKEAEGAGLKASCQFVDIEYDPSRPREVQRLLAEKMKADKNNAARLDGVMKSALNPFTSSIIQACLPKGQVKAFPANNSQFAHMGHSACGQGFALQPRMPTSDFLLHLLTWIPLSLYVFGAVSVSMMTLSGAKGSSVNFSQISCLLGQQELEGRRVPSLATGKTLPSYRKYDTSPRAGGYVADRFLTGIKPQEYYHRQLRTATNHATAADQCSVRASSSRSPN